MFVGTAGGGGACVGAAAGGPVGAGAAAGGVSVADGATVSAIVGVVAGDGVAAVRDAEGEGDAGASVAVFDEDPPPPQALSTMAATAIAAIPLLCIRLLHPSARRLGERHSAKGAREGDGSVPLLITLLRCAGLGVALPEPARAASDAECAGDAECEQRRQPTVQL